MNTCTRACMSTWHTFVRSLIPNYLLSAVRASQDTAACRNTCMLAYMFYIRSFVRFIHTYLHKFVRTHTQPTNNSPETLQSLKQSPAIHEVGRDFPTAAPSADSAHEEALCHKSRKKDLNLNLSGNSRSLRRKLHLDV